MNREQAIQEIHANTEDLLDQLLEKAKGKANRKRSWICPACNQHGRNGDGLTINPKSENGSHLKCFACKFSGDIIALWQAKEGCDFNTALNFLAGQLGITIDKYTPTGTGNARTAPQTKAGGTSGQIHHNEPKTRVQGENEGVQADYTRYYEECCRKLKEKRDPKARDYLKSRGISLETATAYLVGFDDEADPASAPGAMTLEDEKRKRHPAPRIICPTTTSHYIARSIDENTPKQFRKLNPKSELGGGSVGIFNKDALYKPDVKEVFVTEGFFNALSIIEAGSTAIATNSASNTNLLLQELKDHPTAATLILAFDGDEAGRHATEVMRKELQSLNISYIVAGSDIRGDGKTDANDLLVKDRERFITAVQKQRTVTAARPDNVQFYIDNLMAGEIENFKSDVKTGFRNLDAVISGLYSGLYVVAAISSLGKTTFASQMADQIAAAGQDVLFFSMEQSKLEMISKSIARETYKLDPDSATNSLDIRERKLSPAQLETFSKAVTQYKSAVNDRLSVIEGNFNCDISFIADYTRQYIKKTGTQPVVIIDYLQVLQPTQDFKKQSTKEIIDLSITELKRMSRELNLTIFVISSVNRGNYLNTIDFESLKESGSIEYTADVIWGLQLRVVTSDNFAKKDINDKREAVRKAKSTTPREIELLCLKNRYGRSSFSAYFNYYPANDYFKDNGYKLDFDGWTEPKKAGRKLGQ